MDLYSLKDKIVSWKDSLLDELKKMTDFEDIKHVNKKIVFPVIGGLILLTIFYYCYIFAMYLPDENTTKQQSHNKQSHNKQLQTYNFNNPMKPSNVLIDNTNAPVIEDKVPSKYMNVDNIKSGQEKIYINTFNILYDYIRQINRKKYENAIRFLDRSFVAKNHLTANTLENIYNENYYKQCSFFIQNIYKKNDLYHVNVILYDAFSELGGFEDNFIVVTNKNDELKIIHNILSKK